jgi:hypothetical protein
MACKLCTEKLSYANLSKLSRACAPCRRQYQQMRSGFSGYKPEQKEKHNLWDNGAAYEEWVQSLGDAQVEQVNVRTKDEYTEQRCDVRDMRGEVGMPKFAPLESQVFTAWIEEGVKPEKIAEVLGLSRSQVRHVMSVVRMKLRKQMSFYQEVKKLSAEATDLAKRKGR